MSVRRLVPACGVTSSQIIRAVLAAAGDEPIHSVSVALVDDGTIASLNERYLSKPRPTDVLAFDLRDQSGDEGLDGEIVVSVETARRQAAALKLAARQELLRYVIHGALHLAGYEDATPAQRRRMRQAEDRVLAAVGDGCPPAPGRSRCRTKRRTGGRV